MKSSGSGVQLTRISKNVRLGYPNGGRESPLFWPFNFQLSIKDPDPVGTVNLPRFTGHGTRNTEHSQLHYTGRPSRAPFAEGFVTSSDNFDLVVIGCGPAGEKAGAQAAYFGKPVAIIHPSEQKTGSCINTGTVPSKTRRESARQFSRV